MPEATLSRKIVFVIKCSDGQLTQDQILNELIRNFNLSDGELSMLSTELEAMQRRGELRATYYKGKKYYRQAPGKTRAQSG